MSIKESKELHVKIDKSVWEYKRAVGKPFTGDLRQVSWEALGVQTKSMIMQKGSGTSPTRPRAPRSSLALSF